MSCGHAGERASLVEGSRYTNCWSSLREKRRKSDLFFCPWTRGEESHFLLAFAPERFLTSIGMAAILTFFDELPEAGGNWPLGMHGVYLISSG